MLEFSYIKRNTKAFNSIAYLFMNLAGNPHF